MLRSHFRENWFSLRSSIQHFHRKNEQLNNIQVQLSKMIIMNFLFKLTQVYETCSTADALNWNWRNWEIQSNALSLLIVSTGFHRSIAKCLVTLRFFLGMTCMDVTQQCSQTIGFLLVLKQFLCSEDFPVVNEFYYWERWVQKGLFRR